MTELPIRAAALFLLAIFIGCNAARGPVASNLATGQDSAASIRDLEVLRAVLGPHLPSSRDRYIVVVDKVSAPRFEPERIRRNLFADENSQFSPSVLQAVADYHVRNLGNHMLPRLVDSIEGVRFIADDQVETIFAEGVFRGWQRFWRDLHGATALITLSLPGYSSDHASAVVYMSIFKGDVHGDERVLLLRRQDQRWFIEWSQVLFQS